MARLWLACLTSLFIMATIGQGGGIARSGSLKLVMAAQIFEHHAGSGTRQ